MTRAAGSRAGLIARGVAVVALAALAVPVVRDGVSSAIAADNPELALKFDGNNVQALASRAEVLMRAGASDPKARDAAEALARRAFERDPTSAGAASQIAIAYDFRGKREIARKLMRYAEAASQRNFTTQLWLIEDSVSRDNIPEALHHYDVALRASSVAPGILYPILVNAVSEDAVIEPLAATLAKQPAWAPQFVQQLAQSGTDLPRMTRLFLSLQRRGAPVAAETVTTTLERLVQAQNFDAAWSLYAAGKSGLARTGIRDAGFEAEPMYPTPFDWVLGTEGATAEIRPGVNGLALQFDAAMELGGVAARQLLLLPAGARRIEVTGYSISQPRQSKPMLRVRCATNNAELVQAQVPDAPDSGLRFGFGFDVPANCGAQWLELVLRASDQPEGVSGMLDNFRAY